MATKFWRLGVILVMAVFCAATVGAQEEEPATEATPAAEETAATEAAAESQMSYEDTVDFDPGKQADVEARVGEVDIRGVEFLVKDLKSGFMANPFASGNVDLQSELTVRVNMATAADKKQKVGIMVEFLDGEGNLIDRAGNNFSFKDNSKIFTFKHTTLKWAVSHIDKVKVRIEARN